MKIKEVIAATGLTDRAIRLYIENGLVTPENQKSYTGRNNYNFSQTDIDCLEQIAMLRKADFSLEQIKTIKIGGEPAREALLEYLTTKQESVVIGQKIVDALKDFSAEETVTMENICAKIKENMENTPLPESDRKETIGERVEKWLVRIPAIILLVVWSLGGMDEFFALCRRFPFPRFYADLSNYFGTAYIVIPILLSIVVLLLYKKPLFVRKKRRRRRWITGLAFAVTLFTILQPMGIVGLWLMPPVYSETDNPENYLTMGTYVKTYNSDDLYKLFPSRVPRTALAEDSQVYHPDKFLDTTKYYYYFQEVIDPSFNIYAEWVLPENEFAEELNRVRNYYPDGANQQVQWGNWVCMSFTDDTLDFDEAKDKIDYYYLLFAYNEKTGGVRYIASYSMDCGREEDPYFLALEWK